jgi:hypothetical protein
MTFHSVKQNELCSHAMQLQQGVCRLQVVYMCDISLLHPMGYTPTSTSDSSEMYPFTRCVRNGLEPFS